MESSGLCKPSRTTDEKGHPKLGIRNNKNVPPLERPSVLAVADGFGSSEYKRQRRRLCLCDPPTRRRANSKNSRHSFSHIARCGR